MEPKFQSSFIPKGPIGTSGATNFAPQKKRSLFGFISMTLFVISVLLAIGVFGYKEYLLTHIAALGANLDAAKATLMPDEVTDITNADARLAATRTILSQHIALSQFFDFLEQTTEKNIAFTQFTYQTTDKGPTINLSGQGASYAAVKLQADTLDAATFLSSQNFSNLELDSKGNVDFAFSASVDPAAFLYRNQFSSTTASTTLSVAPIATTTPAAKALASSTQPALIVATTTAKAATSTKSQ